MNLADVEDRLAKLDLAAGQDLIYDLLAAYGFTQTAITKLRNGTYDQEIDNDRVLWKKRVWDAFLPDASNDELLVTLDRAQANNDTQRRKPRFYITRNNERIVAADNRTGSTLDTQLNELHKHAAFFMPWTGAEKDRPETATHIDTRVAKQMAKLYDEIILQNPDLLDKETGRSHLNVFFSRLLFCFFAEDTGVFPDGIFTDAVNQLTQKDGSDTADFLDDLFKILDTPNDKRDGVPAHFANFGYVNGSLFRNEDKLKAPAFSRKARNIVVDCGTLEWSDINPDIFGSMIQAVTAGEDRANLGMHYTSVENILKVLNPLFLDELEERFENADTVKKLEALLNHLGEIRVFDPACGSGNFLIVAYRRLRTLEHRILQRLAEIDSSKGALFAESRINLEHFYGIEIDDFAHDIAKLSLWFAKHQMNQEFDDLFGIERPLIPLTETGAIVCDNAARADWAEVCPPTQTTFLCGNPPYQGSKKQTKAQKADMATYFGTEKYERNLDYISLWFFKASDWLDKGARAGLVSTNSVVQGQHAGLLWPPIFETSHIAFAVSDFLWSNGAPGSAGVTCIVVGLANRDSDGPKEIAYFDNGSRRVVERINGYLVPDGPDLIVKATSSPLSERPNLRRGSTPSDGGHLVLERRDADDLLDIAPKARKYVRRYIGARELLAARERFCLWIEDSDLQIAGAMPGVDVRLQGVRTVRDQSDSKATKELASKPNRFLQRRHENREFIAIPEVSSERRQYIPMAYVQSGAVASNLIFAAYGAKPWLLGLLQSDMHMAWMRTVVGRMKSDYRYSPTLCYNTFPFPDLDDDDRLALDHSALGVLAARERWPDRSLAELYDPDKMPANLRTAHDANDALVDSLYRKRPFGSDTERMELLLAMHRELVAEDDEAKKKGGK